MKSLKDMINEELQTIKNVEDLNKFLDKFPNDTKTWRDATGEIKDIAKSAREHLSEFDGIEVEAIDFRSIKKPSDWNTQGKEFIASCMKQMSDATLKRFMKDIGSRFGLKEQETFYEAFTRYINRVTIR